MQFKLDTSIPATRTKISYGKKMLFLGSCFSDEISACMKHAGFAVSANPMGTIFHPIPLARWISHALESKDEFQIFDRQDLYFSFDAASSIYGRDKLEFQTQLKQIQATFLTDLKKASHLFITFGSAFAYVEKEQKLVVANCHKIPASNFERSMSPPDELFAIWNPLVKLLNERFPELELVFTISPVRHLKEGLIENNRSKACLFHLLSQLEEKHQTGYFPAYEILLDELRDYRFFKADLTHPNPQAVEYIWKKLIENSCSAETQQKIDRVLNMRQLEAHRILHPETANSKQFEAERNQKIHSFLEANPDVIW